MEQILDNEYLMLYLVIIFFVYIFARNKYLQYKGIEVKIEKIPALENVFIDSEAMTILENNIRPKEVEVMKNGIITVVRGYVKTCTVMSNMGDGVLKIEETKEYSGRINLAEIIKEHTGYKSHPTLYKFTYRDARSKTPNKIFYVSEKDIIEVNKEMREMKLKNNKDKLTLRNLQELSLMYRTEDYGFYDRVR